MRKTLIALVVIIPMVFMLALFSSVNRISLGVDISVNGITVVTEGLDEQRTLLVDMADGVEHIVKAEVQPNNATDKGYELASTDDTVATIDASGRLVPKREGTTDIVATSHDKNYKDSFHVVVVSSKAYDIFFSLWQGEEQLQVQKTDFGYEATLKTGTYTYKTDVVPMGAADYSVSKKSGDAYCAMSKETQTLYLPFSGEAEFELSVEEGVQGRMTRLVRLHVTRGAEDVVINGEANRGEVKLAYGATSARLCVECNDQPEFFSPVASLRNCTRLGNGRYILDIDLPDGAESFSAQIRAGGKTVDVLFTFADFDISLYSDLSITTDEEGAVVTALTGTPAAFYAVATAAAEDVEYEWTFDGPAEYVKTEGAKLTLTAAAPGEYTISVRAVCLDKAVTKSLRVTVVNRVSAVKIVSDTALDLAKYYTVAGNCFNDGLELVPNVFELKVYTYGTSGAALAGEDVEYATNSDVATVEYVGGKPTLGIHGTGTVTVTVGWKGNQSFGQNVTARVTFNVVKDAVAVKNAPELVEATDKGYAVALTADIMLGTDSRGNVLGLDERNAVLKAHRMRSTYNTEWYKNTEEDVGDGAMVSYVMEFKNDVYGNGKSINADNFTHARDSYSQPLLDLYKGPLYFVKYGQVASVAAQDNCAFLVRTDGVRLYGVNLLGCSDGSLLRDGKNDLEELRLTGTTLEVNADAEIIGCRVRNGRNVLRIYGGNRDGSGYFIDSLAENEGCQNERINVLVEGCILSHSREFVLKMGANRALHASVASGAEPPLRDAQGKAYTEQGKTNNYGELYKDEYFYSNYVMTDVTLKDSVVEASGLFTIGIESNFAGTMLYPGQDSSQLRDLAKDWIGSGGTSFASVLRLEGDVRLYDWKDIELVDSSSLIESPGDSLTGWLKLDVRSMLQFVCSGEGSKYSTVIDTQSDGKQYVHGGIALYGGGRNYSAVDTSGLDEGLGDFEHISINISVLKNATGDLQRQGTTLPQAAGTHDFNFYVYGTTGNNNYAQQQKAVLSGSKYAGVTHNPLVWPNA